MPRNKTAGRAGATPIPQHIPHQAAAVSRRELRPPPPKYRGGSAPLTSGTGTLLPVGSSLILSHWSDCTSTSSPGSLLKSLEELHSGSLPLLSFISSLLDPFSPSPRSSLPPSFSASRHSPVLPANSLLHQCPPPPQRRDAPGSSPFVSFLQDSPEACPALSQQPGSAEPHPFIAWAWPSANTWGQAGAQPLPPLLLFARF